VANTQAPSLAVLALAGLAAPAVAEPPQYSSLGREQRIHHRPDPTDILRVWVVGGVEGDGILIQLPARHRRAPGGVDAAGERLEILVDGGSAGCADGPRMADFLEAVCATSHVVIEHAVVTHHDQDAPAVLAYLCRTGRFTFETVFHGGLACYRPGTDLGTPGRIPSHGAPPNLLVATSSGSVTRALGFLDAQGRIGRPWLVESADRLSELDARGALHGVYADLADALLRPLSGNPVRRFSRAGLGRPFVAEAEAESGRAVDPSQLRLRALWPPDPPRRLGAGLRETLQGNSVVFRLDYGDFSMLFAGDLGEVAQKALLGRLESAQEADSLRCDVLKIPDDGRAPHEPFLRVVAPVIAVASTGRGEFESGVARPPETTAIRLLGGFHRVFHTLLHEKAFSYAHIQSFEDLERLVEDSHVLVETDGTWFRVVEVARKARTPEPPTVARTARGDGTRWIRAR
jgi:beta-lactamase superfamily II metal-dependent hydrolase